MADWVTHVRIAEEIMDMGLDVEPLSFTVGSIAPDCNVENADWSAFTPPREVTHWMQRKNDKSSADPEGFRRKYADKAGISWAERSFHLGYYAHLVTDVEYHYFFRELCPKMAERLRNVPELWAKYGDVAENVDTLKAVRRDVRFMRELDSLMDGYADSHPGSMFHALRQVTEFPNYLDYMPEGAIARKIPIMAAPKHVGPVEHIFILPEELDTFASRVSRKIFKAL